MFLMILKAWCFGFRSKQTADEVSRLNSIKKELQTLDLQLSDDVSIIRKKIESACLVYTEAE